MPLSSFPSPNSTTTNLNAGMDVRSISTANTSPLSNTLSYTSDPTQLTNVPVTNISSSTASAISNDPYAWPPSHVVEKECCGNILITDQQSHIQIWEMEVNSLNTLVQLSLFSSPGSTDVLNVDIQGLDKKELTVTPGNTVNFIGQSIHSIRLSAHGDKQMYIEGKYVVSTTVQIEGKRDPFYIEEKKVNSSDG
ncbi:S-Ena type endospore appendage [Paenibacillus shirakamiensis]|uniref:S-Ena type endospore appendage n=1 Tax=Paenibacillus shirakamiensis TaxID=1265935 RepID=UPI001AE0F6D4|nr:S-Ena type endospore appendage [Paenibacillus shirakamiensis]